MKYNVTIFQPEGYVPSLVFVEAADYLANVLTRMGRDVIKRKNRLVPGRINVVFGAHLNMGEEVSYPPGTIIYNTEQIGSNSSFINDRYLDLLSRHVVWDYSDANLAHIPAENKFLFPFTYHPSVGAISEATEKKFDLVHYGSMNQRRKDIINSISQAGLKVCVIDGLFGAERDNFIRQSRAVLNLHFYESQVFQQIRCFHPLTMGIPVISEYFPPGSAPDFYAESILTAPKDGIIDFTVKLLQDTTLFQRQAADAIGSFRSTMDHPVLAESVQKTEIRLLKRSGQMSSAKYQKLNIYERSGYKPGYLNISRISSDCPDLEIDLQSAIQLPQTFETKDLGEISLHADMVDKICIGNAFQSMTHTENFFTNCLGLLSDGGVLEIMIPHSRSDSAWRSGSVSRLFSDNFWVRVADEHWRDTGLDSRFELSSLQLKLSEAGSILYESLSDKTDISRRLGTVDSVVVNLTKRKLNPRERSIQRAFDPSWFS